MDRDKLWSNPPNAKVQLNSFKDITDYLKKRIKRYNGMEVTGFHCNPGLDVWVSVRLPKNGRIIRICFGSIRTVVDNIHSGLYGETPVVEVSKRTAVEQIALDLEQLR